MKAKGLKTDREYKAALAYIERLMDQSTPDEAELDLWSLLVENYEEARFPIAKPTPWKRSASGWSNPTPSPATYSPTSASKVVSPKS